jgi:HCOMODA/2-hydroxy-3-carboxy-muconic semialdehyde decarboxylase
MEHDPTATPSTPAAARRTRERFIHGEIYRARSDVNAIVHCHTASLIPFGVTRVPARPVYHQSSFVADGVPVFEIRDAGMTDMLVGDAKLGRALAAVLARSRLR